MAKFSYIAKDNEGKTISGTLEANDRQEAIDALRKKDVIIVSVGQKSSRPDLFRLFGRKKKVTLDDIVIFSRQLATMVDAGIPIVGALDILGEQIDKRTFADIVVSVRKDVEAGASLSDAMAKQREVFSTIAVQIVKK